MEKEIIIFTDGGAIGNPGPGGWGAIIYGKGLVTEIGGHEAKTTNNRMEMTAIIEALSRVSDDTPITLYSDSKYVISGITQWVFGWQANDWKTKNKTDVLNKDLWQKLVEVAKDKDIEWKHVAGHVGVAGNERVDVIANSFARGKPAPLYVGDLSGYGIDLSNMKASPAATAKKAGGKAYSYVSMVDGAIERHSTWAECEKRVKGKKARFKKTFSKDDEDSVIQAWLSGIHT